MDLGISGRRAIVCASSRGLGYACAESLAREGVNVIINGRDAQQLEAAAKTLADTGAIVEYVVGDI
ncbi:MAG: SDR family NAD(P)-dependent oxidoreductase, partial [Acidimicrobiales bacterium]|nr:SDR family NAD(P)-dependent oxidoreductase [Acidimicrobiales bacterium]